MLSGGTAILPGLKDRVTELTGQVHRLQAEVGKAGVRTCVCFELRFSSQFTVTKSVLDSGLLGRVHYGEVDYYHGIGPWYGQFRWNVKQEAAGSIVSGNRHRDTPPGQDGVHGRSQQPGTEKVPDFGGFVASLFRGEETGNPGKVDATKR